jgi:hypothetical protein
MKLIFAFLSIALASMTITNGQINIWGNFGLNYSYIDCNNSYFNTSPKFGISAGISSIFFINDYISYQPEICLNQMGGKVQQKSLKGSNYFINKDSKLTYIDIPISLNIRIMDKNRNMNKNKVKYFINVGLYGGYNIWTKESTKISNDINSYFNAPDKKNPFDFGLIIGSTLEVNDRLSFIYRDYFGLVDIFGYPNEFYLNQNMSISIGYKLKTN